VSQPGFPFWPLVAVAVAGAVLRPPVNRNFRRVHVQRDAPGISVKKSLRFYTAELPGTQDGNPAQMILIILNFSRAPKRTKPLPRHTRLAGIRGLAKRYDSGSDGVSTMHVHGASAGLPASSAGAGLGDSDRHGSRSERRDGTRSRADSP